MRITSGTQSSSGSSKRERHDDICSKDISQSHTLPLYRVRRNYRIKNGISTNFGAKLGFIEFFWALGCLFTLSDLTWELIVYSSMLKLNKTSTCMIYQKSKLVAYFCLPFEFSRQKWFIFLWCLTELWNRSKKSHFWRENSNSQGVCKISLCDLQKWGCSLEQ